MKFLLLILSNFKRHKTRTILTVLSIVIAFILFGYLAAIRQAFQMGVSVAGADRLVVRNRISLIQPLPQSYEARIEQIPGVAVVTQASWFGGLYQNNEAPFGQVAVEPDEFFLIYPEYLLTPAEKEAWLKTRTGAIAGRDLADRFGWKVGDKIPIQATYNTPRSGGNTWTFDLVGIYTGATENTEETSMYFRHDYLDENRLRGAGRTGWYNVKLTDAKHAEAVVKAVDERFANSPYETRTETEKAFMQGFAEQMGNIGAIVTAILSAVFFTILLVAGNTMAQAVRERTSELGVLKAIGYTDTQTLMLVLAESLLISCAGGGIGLLIGWMMVKGGDPTNGALPVFYFPPDDLIRGIFFVILLGIITGVLPALQAMRLNAVDALRRE